MEVPLAEKRQRLCEGIEGANAFEVRKILYIFSENYGDAFLDHHSSELMVEIVLAGDISSHAEIQRVMNAFEREWEDVQPAQVGQRANLLPGHRRAVRRLVFWPRKVRIHFRQILDRHKQIDFCAQTKGQDLLGSLVARISRKSGVDEDARVNQHAARQFFNAHRFLPY